MLHPDEIASLLEIADKAVEEMYQSGYNNFFLESIAWDDENSTWLVDFYSDNSNLEHLVVTLEPCNDGYRSKGVFGK